MQRTRREFKSALKARVAIEALKERESLGELSKQYELHPSMISKGKQEFLEKSSDVFDKKSKEESGIDPEKLYAKIGQLEMENDFLKNSLKKTGLGVSVGILLIISIIGVLKGRVSYCLFIENEERFLYITAIIDVYSRYIAI